MSFLPALLAECSKLGVSQEGIWDPCFISSCVMARQDEQEVSCCECTHKLQNCNLKTPLFSQLETVEDFERCWTSLLPRNSRDYFQGTAGRGLTYRENREAFDRIKIVPKILRDVSHSRLSTTVLGTKVELPIGLSPVAFHRLAHPEGEIATVKAVSRIGAVMILSSISSVSIEAVAEAAGPEAVLWMQTYIFTDRDQTVDLVRRAESAGFKAVVVTVDTPMESTLRGDVRNRVQFEDDMLANIFNHSWDLSLIDASLTFKDITWLKSITRLPVVAKGVLSAEDAVRVVKAGASGILVSNHGGRQMDSAPATIDVLPGIVEALRNSNLDVEVYLDGGVRNGYDVYKAIARGARAVFVGRPQIWGLVVAGENGVHRVLEIIKQEFNETMIIAGSSDPSKIQKSTLVPPVPGYPFAIENGSFYCHPQLKNSHDGHCES